MARPLRIEFAGAVYDVMARGNHGRAICADGNTTVQRRWLAERLVMGYETRISQAVSYVESTRSPAVLRLKSTVLRYEK